MRYVHAQPHPLAPAALEADLPAKGIRLCLLFAARTPLHVPRRAVAPLRVALRQLVRRRGIQWRIVVRVQGVPRGEAACWVGVAAPSAQLAFDTARILLAKLLLHATWLEASVAASQDTGADQRILLEAMELRGGWRIPINGAMEELRESLKGVSQEFLADFPRLRLARIFLMCKDDRLHSAENEWRSFRRDLAMGRYPNLPAWEVGLVRELVASYAESSVTPNRIQHLEHLGRDIPSPDHGALGVLYNCMCFLHIEACNLDHALGCADLALRQFRSADSRYGSLFIHYNRGIVHSAAGRYADARREYRRGLMLARKELQSTHELPSIGRALLAGLSYTANQPDLAARDLDHILEAIEYGDSWSHLMWLVYCVHIELASLEHHSATLVNALHRALSFARKRRFQRLETRIRLLEIEIDLRHGRLAFAQQHARALKLNELCQRNPEQDLAWQETILHARYISLLLRMRNPDPGDRAQADALVASAGKVGNFALLVHALLVRAQIALQGGDVESAFATVEEVLTLVLPERPVRLILDHPEAAELFRAYQRDARKRRAGRGVANMLRQLEKSWRAEVRIARTHACRISLTEKELAVIKHLALGLRNKEIAQRLQRSEDVVKFHLKRINLKFGVHKRVELIARARESGYLT